MANDGANGTTFNWATTTVTISAVNSISFTEAGNEVDVTSMGDTSHEYVIGIADPECTIEYTGANNQTIGATGALKINWNDGGSDTMAAAVITNVEVSGGLDGALTTSLTFKPAPA